MATSAPGKMGELRVATSETGPSEPRDIGRVRTNGGGGIECVCAYVCTSCKVSRGCESLYLKTDDFFFPPRKQARKSIPLTFCADDSVESLSPSFISLLFRFIALPPFFFLVYSFHTRFLLLFFLVSHSFLISLLLRVHLLFLAPSRSFVYSPSHARCRERPLLTFSHRTSGTVG